MTRRAEEKSLLRGVSLDCSVDLALMVGRIAR